MSGNSRGKRASALPNGDPAFTSARSAATRWRSRSFSDSSVSAVSARSSGRPDVTRPASWRVQIARPVAEKTLRRSSRSPQPEPGSLAAVPLPTGCTCSGTSACARNWLRTALAVSASIKPRRVSPWASRASNE